MRPLLVVVALLATLWSPVAAQNYVFGPNVRVNDDLPGPYRLTYTPGQHCIAARGDTVYLVWRDDRALDGHIYFARSTDGGQSFGPNLRIDNAPGAYTPGLALDDSGRIHVTWQNRNSGGGAFIYYARSSDGGLTFSVPLRACDSFASSQFGRASIATSRSGRLVYVARTEQSFSPDSAAHIMLSRSTDGGVTFTRPDTRVSPDTAAFNPSVAVFNDTIVLVAWFRSRMARGSNIYFARSVDGGVSFGPTLLINDTTVNGENQGYPSMGVDTLGRVFVVYKLGTQAPGYLVGLSVSEDTGSTFRREFGVPGTSTGYLTSLHVAPGGQLYLAWDFFGDWDDVGFAFSPDGGDTFFSPVDPTENPLETNQSCPTVTVNEQGRVFCAWSDSRNSVSGYDIYFSTGILSEVPEPNPGSVSRLSCEITPNPARGSAGIAFTLRQAGCVGVSIYDRTGSQVRVLDKRKRESGMHFLLWDGLDRQGQPAATGVYFVAVESPPGRICRKFEYIRQ